MIVEFVCLLVSRPVSFQGAEYVQYDTQYQPLPIQPIDLQLFVTTPWLTGLILLTQSSQSDYITLTLIDGKLVFSYVINDEVVVTINSIYVADNKRHRVRVYRIQSVVNINVDNVTVSTGNVPSTISDLVVDQAVFIGGTLSLLFTRLASSHGFIGCLQQVTLNGVDLTSLMTSSSGESISIKGHVTNQCEDKYAVSVNFPDGDSSLMIRDWIDGTLSVSLQFRTLQFHSELLYSATRYQTQWFETRISNSHIQVTLQRSSGSEIIIVPTSVNDGLWHSLNITYTMTRFVVNVDDSSQTRNIPFSASWFSSLRSEPLFVAKRESVVGMAVPAQHPGFPGYTGCIRDMRIRGQPVDVFRLIERQYVTGRVFVGDCEPEDGCKEARCRNEGQCVRRYNGFECNCTATGYTGTICQQGQ